MASENKMGTGKMGRLIFSMSLPAILSMLVNALYNIVDSYFVAQYSKTALSAVSLVFPLQMLVISIAVGTGIGVNALISRKLGERDTKSAEQAAEQGIVLSLIAAAVFVLVGVFLSAPFLSFFKPQADTLVYAVQYSQIAVGLSCFVMVSIMLEKIQQGTGNMIIPMVQGLVGAIVNTILDPLLIFGIGPFPELGVVGAAVATIIGQVFAMLIGIYGVFFRQKILKLNMREYRWSGKAVADIYRVGLPSIIMQSISSVMIVGLNKILIGFSEMAVTVLGIYFKLQTFVFMPVFGLNQGALPIMSYNYGARDRNRLFSAYRISLISAVCMMMVGLVIFQLIPQTMLGLFADPNDVTAAAEMMQIGVPALRIISLSFLGAAFSIMNSTFFQALARGIYSLYVSVIRQLFVILPAAALLAHFFGLDAIWYCFPIAEIAGFLSSYLFFWWLYRKELSQITCLDTTK